MLDFKKYNSIENTYQKVFIASILAQHSANTQYVVQEKIHGANFSFITDGKTIETAKRTGMIQADEQFYNADSLLNKYRNAVLALYQELNERFHCKTMTIFGELFGGAYPHPNVPKDKNSKLVQKDVYYCPSNDFCVFDISMYATQYLDVHTASLLSKKHGFLYAEPLFEGNLEECLAYPNIFNTTIPKYFGLPEIEGNICEGIVIRPIEAIYLHTGTRVLLKNKNEKWAENNNLNKVAHTEEPISAEAWGLCDEIYKFVTENRLANLISKIGTINPDKDAGKLLGLYNKDVLEDFFKTYQAQYTALEKQDSKAINKFLNRHAAKLIENYLEKHY